VEVLSIKSIKHIAALGNTWDTEEYRSNPIFMGVRRLGSLFSFHRNGLSKSAAQSNPAPLSSFGAQRPET
jgi:hypothetical protein